MVNTGTGRAQGGLAPVAWLKRSLGFGSFDRLKFLAGHVPPGGVGAEIGVHMGDFSARLLEGLAPSRLHLIDPWHYEASETYAQAWYGGAASGKQSEMDARFDSVCQRFAERIADGQVVVQRAMSQDALAQFEDASLDWVYVDGNHLYDFVLRDIELSLAKVRPGGFICADDYQDGGWWNGGVKKAVDECVASGKAVLVAAARDQAILRRP